MKCKMYCIFAKESLDKMKGSRGKLASMAGHAYLHAFWNCLQQSDSIDYMALKMRQASQYKESEKAYKITLVVDTVAELKELYEEYKNQCGVSLVTDSALTVFDEPTTVCLGLGPISEEIIGDSLKILKTLT